MQEASPGQIHKAPELGTAKAKAAAHHALVGPVPVEPQQSEAGVAAGQGWMGGKGKALGGLVRTVSKLCLGRRTWDTLRST